MRFWCSKELSYPDLIANMLEENRSRSRSGSKLFFDMVVDDDENDYDDDDDFDDGCHHADDNDHENVMIFLAIG